MEEEKKELQKDRIIHLMSGLEVIPRNKEDATVKYFLEQSLSESGARYITVQASSPPLD